MTRRELDAEARALGLKLVPLSGPERVAHQLEGGHATRLELANALDMQPALVSVYLSHLRNACIATVSHGRWQLVAPVYDVPARHDARNGAGGDWEARLTETWAERKARRKSRVDAANERSQALTMT